MDNNNPDKFKPNICLLVVIQAQDADNTVDALVNAKFHVTRMTSYGGFLGRRNATLLIALRDTRKEQALAIIKKNCRQRTEYISVPMEASPLPIPTPTPVTIGGATVFTLALDYFEEV
ncbi:MAG TPA: cyclic-di-AMP receptor [Bellilinea sp.]|nr:cyclic-di-AMP receptor [Bellilinea sp.]